MSIEDIKKRRQQKDEITKKSREAALAYVMMFLCSFYSEIKNRKAKKASHK